MTAIEIADTRLSQSEIAAALRVLRSGALRQGAECAAFEAAFAEQVGARFAVACASGSAGLHMTYLAMLQPGDEVLVPAFTFIASASMASLAGVKPVFCDIDPETLLLDLADAEARLSERTRAVCAVHLFGNPCDTQALREFAQRHELALIWDAAQAHGAVFRGQDVGSEPDAVIYSFYPTKGIFVGEGGMVCTGDAELAHELQLLRSHGEARRYEHVRLGFNYRMTDVAAAIGRAQLSRWDRMLERRRRTAGILAAGLGRLPGIRCQTVTRGGESAWHQFAVMVDPNRFGCTRDALAEALAGQGIATGIHYPRGLHRQPVFADVAAGTELPVTDAVADEVLTLPVHHGVNDNDARRIVGAVAGAYRQDTPFGRARPR